MIYKISSQNDTINTVLLALEETSIGKGIKIACDIEVKTGDYGSTIVFTPNGTVEITHQDFFWLGYFVGRDYNKPADITITIVTEEEKRKNKKALKADKDL